jgi:hypothetical protein
VQHAAGIRPAREAWDTVTEGQPLFTLSTDEPGFARAPRPPRRRVAHHRRRTDEVVTRPADRRGLARELIPRTGEIVLGQVAVADADRDRASPSPPGCSPDERVGTSRGVTGRSRGPRRTRTWIDAVPPHPLGKSGLLAARAPR